MVAAHAKGAQSLVRETEAFLEAPDLLSEEDKYFLAAHDIASRRARGEHLERTDLSKISLADALSQIGGVTPPQHIGKEFAQEYLNHRTTNQENPNFG
jgi:hypothetical protein